MEDFMNMKLSSFIEEKSKKYRGKSCEIEVLYL
jgi:hypothetical protein